METTGLETFLAGFGVQVGNDRIIRIPTNRLPNPEWLVAVVSSDRFAQSRNPIVEAFARDQFGFLKSTRTVRPLPAGPQPNQRYRAETLMIAPGVQSGQYLWAETNLQTDAMQLIKDLSRRDALNDKVSHEPLPVAVAVSETLPGGTGPHSVAQAEEKPRLIVFGNTGVVSNYVMSEAAIGLYYDLFASAIAWEREKPSNIGIEPKQRDYYTLPSDANVSRMHWMPAILMIVAIIGLGTGVWVVRRR
jgi:hypothetical protein